MALLGISTGTTPNDGTGDSLIVGADKVNKNFQEIYSNIFNSYELNNIKTLKKTLKGKFINYVSDKWKKKL